MPDVIEVTYIRRKPNLQTIGRTISIQRTGDLPNNLDLNSISLEKMNYITGIDLFKILDASDVAEEKVVTTVPIIKSDSIVSGLSGVFSGFSKHVTRISSEYEVDPRDVYRELGKRKIVAVVAVGSLSFKDVEEKCI